MKDILNTESIETVQSLFNKGCNYVHTGSDFCTLALNAFTTASCARVASVKRLTCVYIPKKEDDWNVILDLQAAVVEQGKTVSLDQCEQYYNDNKNWHDDTGAQIVYWLRTSSTTV